MFIQVGKDGSLKASNSTFDAVRIILAPGESVYDTNTNRIIYVNNVGGVLPDFDVNTFQRSPVARVMRKDPEFGPTLPLNFSGETKPATPEELNSFPEGSIRTVDGKQEMLSGDVWRVLEGVSTALDAVASTGTGTGAGSGDGTGATATGIPTDLGPGERYTPNPSGGYDYIQYNPATKQWEYSRGDKAGTPYNFGDGATTTPFTPTGPTGPYIIPDEKTQDDVNRDLLESTTNNQRFILDLLKYLPIDQWLVDVTTFDANGNPITEKALSPAVQFYLDAWEKANGIALEREALQTDLRIADINARGSVDVARFGATPFGALAAAGADVNALQQALMTQSLGAQAGMTPEQRIAQALAATGGQYGALGGATGGYTADDIATLVRGGLTGQQMAQQALAATGGPFGALGLSAQAPTAAQITDLATRQALAQTGGPYGALTLLPSTSPVTFSNIESLARGGLTADQLLQQTRAQYLPQLLQASPQSLGGLAAILGQEAVKNIYAPYTGQVPQVPGLVSNEFGTEQLLSGGSVPAFTQQQLQSNAPISTIGQYERQTPYEQGATLANISMLGLDPEKAMYGVTPGTDFTSGSLGAQAV